MKLNKANIFNLIFTILFFSFNILITYNANIDYKLWLISGLAICGFALFSSLTLVIIYSDLFSEILFFINIILALYYIYPIFYEFV
ncbi:type II toxin-antitoxin system antitoxin TsaA [Staphylococcus epidermidis]|uniref:type II toxin-antitoxin system antitoxin TsaA n=1 Tax=Staphylococcus epidermidis TaxID=1282 RepID=UPI000C174099|nr:hypothetical protein [Staphylococcus epidermidis]RLY63733.1 hypothetical protein D9V07_06565 [Staphylococcus epidermidis]